MYNIEELLNSVPEEQLISIILITILSAAVVYLALFVMQAVATCVMAKRRGFKRWWLGMIPYVNYYVLGKLAGSVRIFRMDIKNIGIFVAISAFLLDISNLTSLLSSLGILSFLSIGYLSYAISSFTTIIDLVFIVAYFALAFALFGKYAPAQRMVFTILSFIQILFPIFLLVIMKKKPYNNFDEYYKEQMAKRYGQTYNPYVNPYRTNENPFENSNSNNKQNENEDPFDEFRS